MPTHAQTDVAQISRVIFIICNNRHAIMFRLLVLLRKTAKNGKIYEAVICATAENGRFHCFFRMAVICDNENDSSIVYQNHNRVTTDYYMMFFY